MKCKTCKWLDIEKKKFDGERELQTFKHACRKDPILTYKWLNEWCSHWTSKTDERQPVTCATCNFIGHKSNWCYKLERDAPKGEHWCVQHATTHPFWGGFNRGYKPVPDRIYIEGQLYIKNSRGEGFYWKCNMIGQGIWE